MLLSASECFRVNCFDMNFATSHRFELLRAELTGEMQPAVYHLCVIVQFSFLLIGFLTLLTLENLLGSMLALEMVALLLQFHLLSIASPFALEYPWLHLPKVVLEQLGSGRSFFETHTFSFWCLETVAEEHLNRPAKKKFVI